MRDIGEPTVMVHVLSGTAEEVDHNRKNVEMAFESAFTRCNGYGTKVTIHWKNEPPRGKPRDIPDGYRPAGRGAE